MINLLISLAIGVAVTLLVKLAGFSIWAGLVPGLIAFFGAFILLARRVIVKIQALMATAQKDLQTQSANPREQKARIEKAVKILEQGLAYEPWQFGVGGEIHANIGMIQYMVGDLEGAQSHFVKGSARNYMAKALQGALFYRKKDLTQMEGSFEAAVKHGKKEAIVWAAYAWCLVESKQKDKALSVLARAVQTNPSDEKLKSNLSALQNDKRLKMQGYAPLWWQFGLEAPPTNFQGGRPVRYQRR